MRAPAVILALLSFVLLIAPTVAGEAIQDIPPGELVERDFDVPDGATVEINVDLLAGTSVKVLLLDDDNYAKFEADEQYQARHESTTYSHLTLTDQLPAGTWHVVLIASGAGEVDVELSVDVRTSGLDLGGLVLPALAALAAVIIVAVLLVKRKGK